MGAGGKRERFLNAFGQPSSQTAEQAEIDISYDLDLFGRLRNSSEAARASLLATQAAQDNVRLAVASSAAAGYIGLRALDARLAVVRETVAARADSLRIARRRAQAGYATRLEAEQAEAELRGTEQLVPILQLAITRQEDALSVLLGENPRAIERGVTLPDLMSPAVPTMLPSQLLRRRPDIAQAGVAAARRDQAAYAYRKTALNAFREVEDALAALQRTSEQELILRQQRDVLAQALGQATNRYSAGYTSYLDQLDAQRGLLSADLSLVQASSDRLSATVNLFQALGGGWPEDSPASR